MFPLHIFPEHSLAQSVITTVWIGVFVVAFFNLRLGWPFSGLVVPGYLVPLMIAKPASALVVCAEGIITYLLVRYLCDRFVKSGIWSSFFGRDRFFALIVVSLIVRIVLDGWLLPSIGEFINTQLKVNFDYRNHLSSFGLIIVALIANQFWKTGVVRGMIPFSVTVGATFLIVRFVLMEYTNFNIGNLEYMYENISTSLVASPKAYIILLTSGFIASRLNLLYGWDFNGILIPSLLALEWYHPMAIVTTILEAFIILTLSVILLKSPIFQSITVEGARKLLLFFNVSFAYKLFLGFFQEWFETPFAFTDLFGYGYLVPTLIAVKMHDKKIPIRLTRATLQASLTGAVVASLLGFVLTFVPQTWAINARPDANQAETLEPTLHANPMDALRVDKLLLYQKRAKDAFVVPLPSEIDAFSRSLRNIDRYISTHDADYLQLAIFELKKLRYSLSIIDGRYLYLRENCDIRGWGFYVIDLQQSSRLVIEVPAPVDEWAVLESGAFLFTALDARALAIGGSPRKVNRDGSSDVLNSGNTLYSTFHRVFTRNSNSVLQIRGYGEKSFESMLDGDLGEEREDGTRQSVLWIKNRIPSDLDFSKLKSLMGSFRVAWGNTSHRNLQRQETHHGFAELVLNREQRKRLFSLSAIGDVASGTNAAIASEEGFFSAWLLEHAETIGKKETNQYLPAKVEELLLFDQEIITPLLALLETCQSEHQLEPDQRDELRVISATASVFNYRFLIFQDIPSASNFLILAEKPSPNQWRHWGTYVFRLGPSNPYCIQVPRPLYERNCLEYASMLYRRLGASYLMLAGAHPHANGDGSADVARSANKTHLFNLVNQAVVRQSNHLELLTVQVRAFSGQDEGDGASADILFSMADGCTSTQCLSDLPGFLYNKLHSDDVSLRLVSGVPETAGYEAASSIQAHYAFLFSHAHFCILWLSPDLRDSVSQNLSGSAFFDQFREVQLPVSYTDLYDHLVHRAEEKTSIPCPEDIVDMLGEYAVTRDILLLHNLSARPDISRLELVVDVDSRIPFLSLQMTKDAFPVLFNLGLASSNKALVIPRSSLNRQEVNRYVFSLASRLEIEE